jgi:cytochrome b
MQPRQPPEPAPAVRAGRLWDLPTRLFHWALVVLVSFSLVSIQLGGFWKDWHMRSGYAILALVVFRLLWGFAGSRTARFATFVRGPRAVLAYFGGRQDHPAGHNPAGGWSVLALLAVLGVQAATGLFSNDGSFSEGPLARLIAGETSDLFATVHRYGEWAIYGVIGLHLAAIAWYGAIRREPLVRAMVTGDRADIDTPTEDDMLTRLRALLLAALAAALVGWVVTL